MELMALKLNKSMLSAVGAYISKFKDLSLKLEEAQEPLSKSQAKMLFLNGIIDTNFKAYKTMVCVSSHNLEKCKSKLKKEAIEIRRLYENLKGTCHSHNYVQQQNDNKKTKLH